MPKIKESLRSIYFYKLIRRTSDGLVRFKNYNHNLDIATKSAKSTKINFKAIKFNVLQ
jgi:hypothetical protein